MSMNLHVANVFVIGVTLLQASGRATAPEALDPTTHREAYEVYATELPRPWVQLKGDVVLQQETERGIADPCGLLKNQTGEWADVAKDFEEQNARVWLLQRGLPEYFQYRLLRRRDIDAQDARVPGTYPGRPGVAQYAAVSAVGFNHDRTKAMVYVHVRLEGSFTKLELTDGKWQPVGETCKVVS